MLHPLTYANTQLELLAAPLHGQLQMPAYRTTGTVLVVKLQLDKQRPCIPHTLLIQPVALSADALDTRCSRISSTNNSSLAQYTGDDSGPLHTSVYMSAGVIGYYRDPGRPRRCPYIRVKALETVDSRLTQHQRASAPAAAEWLPSRQCIGSVWAPCATAAQLPLPPAAALDTEQIRVRNKEDRGTGGVGGERAETGPAYKVQVEVCDAGPALSLELSMAARLQRFARCYTWRRCARAG
jgi:hypothetical protein